MRLFCGLTLSDTILVQLAQYQDYLRTQGTVGFFSHPSLFHLTIFFMGNVEASSLPEIKKALITAAGKTPAFSLNLSAPGAFQREEEHTLWYGVEAPGAQILHANVKEQLVPLGFSDPRKIFRPHITLMRRVRHLPELIIPEIVTPPMQTNTLTLFYSHRPAGRLTYTPLFTAPLGEK